MTRPKHLLLVRHGQSQGNVVHELGAKGDMRGYTDEFKNMLSSNYRLSNLGQAQARMAGEWLKHNGFGSFGGYYHSSYVRAKETAMLLNLDNPRWVEAHRLREVSHGVLDGLSRGEHKEIYPDVVRKMAEDAFHTAPPNGESIAQMTDRLKLMLIELAGSPNDENVILVCHSDVMWGFTQLIEDMPIPDWLKLNNSKDAFHRIHHCQIIEYSRVDPVTGDVSENWDWVRWICPWDESLSKGTWAKVHRPHYNNEELWEQVEKFPRLPDL